MLYFLLDFFLEIFKGLASSNKSVTLLKFFSHNLNFIFFSDEHFLVTFGFLEN